MDVTRFASDVRLLRRRRGWTQERLASVARVSRWSVVMIETGGADRQPVERLIRVVAALGAQLSLRIQYHGEGLDRLRDRQHAAVVDQVVALLRGLGWDVATEVSFSVYGERGSIDILAYHPVEGVLLVVEVKSVIPDLGGMLTTLDRKTRLAPDIARERGWRAREASRLLVVAEGSTARRRVREYAATFAAALPARNVAVTRWLRSPVGRLSGLLFLSAVRHPDGGR